MTAIVASLLLFASVLPVITTVRHLDVSPKGWCRVDIKFPQIGGIAPASLESTIDTGLRERFLDYPESRYGYEDLVHSSTSPTSMTDCEEKMHGSIADLERRGQTPKTYQAFANRATFRIGFKSVSFVSLVGDGVEVSARQAYPNTYWWTANVDLESGRFLGFDDIFRTDGLHRKRLDELIYASLRREWGNSSPEIATTFKTGKEARGELQPLLCPGGIRFADIFSQHWIAAFSTFVDAHDLIASGVMKDPRAIDVIRSKGRADSECGI
ncbi:MAG TPA: hypothetical protein VID24_03660 [Candidatus Eremiobacteraceae bacterium]|jgi:hypothetical protein